MKKTIAILVTLSILFQNCKAYIKLPYNSSEFLKEDKVKIKLTSNQVVYGRIVKKYDDSITVKGNNIVQTLYKSDIKKIKKKEYSTLKTLAYITIIGLTTITYIFSKTLKNIDIKIYP